MRTTWRTASEGGPHQDKGKTGAASSSTNPLQGNEFGRCWVWAASLRTGQSALFDAGINLGGDCCSLEASDSCA